MKVIWAPLALDRAAEIARHIAADRPAAAERWIDGLARLAAGLSRAPKRGRIVPEVGRPDLREILHGRYRLIYRLDPKRVVVLTVRHARRAFERQRTGGARLRSCHLTRACNRQAVVGWRSARARHSQWPIVEASVCVGAGIMACS